MGDETLWVALRLKTLKWHYCMKRLAYELIEEVGIDEKTVVEMQPTDQGYIDNPGMVLMDRSYQNIKIDTFKLVIPTEDFEYFHDRLRDAPVRRFRNGDEYHKIHGWQACAIFTRDQRETLVDAMAEILPDVRMTAEQESLEFSRRLNRANGIQTSEKLKGNN